MNITRASRVLCSHLKGQELPASDFLFGGDSSAGPPSCGRLRKIAASGAQNVLQILGTSNSDVGCGLAPAPEAQQSLEGCHRLPAPIVPKHEFIKVHRELLPAYPV